MINCSLSKSELCFSRHYTTFLSFYVSSRAAAGEDSDSTMAFSRSNKEGGRDVNAGQLSQQPFSDLCFTEADPATSTADASLGMP